MGKEKSPWGKVSKADAKNMKKIASTGLIGGKSKGIRIPK